MNRRNGFAPIPRDILGNPFFRKRKLRNPHPQRMDQEGAYIWLYMQAAYKADEIRNPFGIFHISRGQLCITIRELGKTWHWPVATVHRYLKKLHRNSMISLGTYQTGTRNGTRVERLSLESPYDRTVITISDYDKFQKLSPEQPRYPRKKSEQEAEQVLRHRRAGFHPLIQREMPVHGIVAQADKHLNNLDSPSLSGAVGKARIVDNQPERQKRFTK